MSVELLGKCRKICGMKRLFFLIKLSEWKDSGDTKLQNFCVLEIDINSTVRFSTNPWLMQ